MKRLAQKKLRKEMSKCEEAQAFNFYYCQQNIFYLPFFNEISN